MSIPSTKPYLIRALYEWCGDHGFTPYIAVKVDATTRVPNEHVHDGQIVLNICESATSQLILGNDVISFLARFSGVAREIVIPVARVAAIYARENGAGMAFEVDDQGIRTAEADSSITTEAPAKVPEPPTPAPPAPPRGRPNLQRVK